MSSSSTSNNASGSKNVSKNVSGVPVGIAETAVTGFFIAVPMAFLSVLALSAFDLTTTSASPSSPPTTINSFISSATYLLVPGLLLLGLNCIIGGGKSNNASRASISIDSNSSQNVDGSDNINDSSSNSKSNSKSDSNNVDNKKRIVDIKEASSSNQRFLPIEGCRTVFSFWVVACHQSNIYQFMCLMLHFKGDNIKFDILRRSVLPKLAIGLGYQVDAFFVISGFALAWKIFNNNNSNILDNSLINNIVVNSAKRILRLWPVIIAAIVVTAVLGDYKCEPKVFLKLLTFPKGDRDIPSTFLMGWSNRVDIEASLVLVTCIYLMFRFNTLNFQTSSMLSFLSLGPRLYRFLTDDRVSYLKLSNSQSYADSMLPIILSADRQTYFAEKLFPEMKHLITITELGERKTNLFNREYLITHQRITPFFIGLTLAIAIKNAYYPDSNRGSSKSTNSNNELTNKSNSNSNSNGKSFLYFFLHKIALLISCFLICQPALGAYQSIVRDWDSPVQPEYKFKIDFLVSVLGRTTFSLAFSYLLYRCLVPDSHPLKIGWLATLLSSSALVTPAKYSFALYMIHMRIVCEVNWRYFTPTVLDSLLGPSNMAAQFILCLIVSYSVSLLLACIIHHCFEVPCLSMLKKNNLA